MSNNNTNSSNNLNINNNTNVNEEDNNKEPIIRRRTFDLPKSRRSRNGLISYAKDYTSQNGEDGIIEKIFNILPSLDDSTNYRTCVDVGAWDGKHLSNTYSLLVPTITTNDNNNYNGTNNNSKIENAPTTSSSRPPSSSSTTTTTTTTTCKTSKITKNATKCCWHGVLIEADNERYKDLKSLHEPLGNVCLNVEVSCKMDNTTTNNYYGSHGENVEQGSSSDDGGSSEQSENIGNGNDSNGLVSILRRVQREQLQKQQQQQQPALPSVT